MPSKIRKRRPSTSPLSRLAKNNRLKQELLTTKTSPSSLLNAKNFTNMTDHYAGKERDYSKSGQKSAQKLPASLLEIGYLDRSLHTNKTINEFTTSLDLSQNHHRHTKSVPAEKINRHRRYSSSLLLTDKRFGGSHLIYDATTLEGGAQPRLQTKNEGCLAPGVVNCLKEVNNSLTTSKELLKLLSHVWRIEEKQNQLHSSTTVVSALKYELNRAHTQVEKLAQEQRSGNFDNLSKQFAEEKAAWKSKEQDRIRAAVKSVARELQVEKKLRRQTERLNKKLGRELAKAMKEAESEKRAREILEQVCEELTKGIGEDRAEFEELKKEVTTIREEVEKEREMLQLADILREERVHMKLMEAKHEFEEKHAQVNRLKSNLEEFLKANGSSYYPKEERIKPFEEFLNEKLDGLISCQNKQNDKDQETGTGSQWSHAVVQEKCKPVSVDDEITEKRHENNCSLERYNSDCIEWEFSAKHANGDASNGCLQDEDLGSPSFAQMKEYEDEMERYKIIKDLRDHIVSGSGLASCEGFLMLQQAT